MKTILSMLQRMFKEILYIVFFSLLITFFILYFLQYKSELHIKNCNKSYQENPILKTQKDGCNDIYKENFFTGIDELIKKEEH